MREELERRLVERWPGWFDVLGFENGDGWFPLLWKLFTDLEPLVEALEGESGQPFSVVRVREEAGGLRVYVSEATDAIAERIEAAHEQSRRTCEVCGEVGSRRQDGWIRTRCEEHWDE